MCSVWAATAAGDRLRELRALGNNPLQGIGEVGYHGQRLWSCLRFHGARLRPAAVAAVLCRGRRRHRDRRLRLAAQAEEVELFGAGRRRCRYKSAAEGDGGVGGAGGATRGRAFGFAFGFGAGVGIVVIVVSGSSVGTPKPVTSSVRCV